MTHSSQLRRTAKPHGSLTAPRPSLLHRLTTFWHHFDKLYLLIIAVVFLIFIPFYSTSYINGHDTYYHVANVASLAEHNWLEMFTAQIFGGIASDFGYGSGLFYPQLSHLVAASFVKLGFNVVTGIKIAHILAMILSGCFMYKLLKTLKIRRTAAFAGTLLYMLAPYHIMDTFTRDALAEVWIFPFLPLVFLGLVYLWQKRYRYFYLCFIFGTVGLAESHLVMTMYIAGFLILCLLLQGKKLWHWAVIKRLLIATSCTLLICSPLLTSILTMRASDANYTVFTSAMSSAASTTSQVQPGYKLFGFYLSGPDILVFTLNIVAVALFIYAIVKYKTIKNTHNSWALKSSFLLAGGGTLLFSNFFPWFMAPDFMQNIQFPWRLSIIIVFGLSLATSIALNSLHRRHLEIIIALIVATSIFYTVKIIQNTTFISPDLNNIYRGGMGGSMEYLPTATKDNIEYFNNRDHSVVILSDHTDTSEQASSNSVDVSILSDTTPNLAFQVSHITDTTTLELPRLYYPGYQIVAYDTNGQSTTLSYSESPYGFIQITLASDATVQVSYAGTTIMQISRYLQIVGLGTSCVVIYLVGQRLRLCSRQ